jgi:formimidoylglutamate deiminase
MPAIHAKHAMLQQGWADNVRIGFQGGRITLVEPNAAPHVDDARVDALLPALSNLHSHSFQRAMAGMTERQADGHDNFWSWRELMYRFLDHLTPDDIEAIAALAFMEMLEAGYAAVGEFHYVHHAPGGVPYDALSETSQRIFAAAVEIGIGLTHLPVLYTYGATGERPLIGGQQRFGNDFNRFCSLVESAQASMRALPGDYAIGIAPHSLRATTPSQFKLTADAFPQGPIHIHAAEQVKEVEDTVAWLGARPVEWLLDNANIDQRWCLIHATHMSETEATRLARSGAVVGLCPLTESNLGDGIFNGETYLAAGGAIGVGSDSCIRISVSGELSTLEYTQRLKHRARNVTAQSQGSTGEQLYRRALAGGAQSLARKTGAIEIGNWADLVSLDLSRPSLTALRPDQLVDGWVFAANDNVVSDVWSAGRHVVRDGQHRQRDVIIDRFRQTMRALKNRI